MGFCYTAQVEQGQSRRADSDTDLRQSGMPQTSSPKIIVSYHSHTNIVKGSRNYQSARDSRIPT